MRHNGATKMTPNNSNINKVIEAVLNVFFFFLHASKVLKAPKAPKSIKRTKSIKAQPSKSTKRR